MEYSNSAIIEVILDYIQKNQEEFVNESGTYFVNREKMFEILKEDLSRDFSPTTAETKAEECCKQLVSNRFMNVTEEGVEIKKTLKKAKLENKYNITIESLKNNADIIIAGAVTVSIVAGIIVGTVAGIKIREEKEKNYAAAQVVTDSEQYNLSDIYVVYNADNTYFCTRELIKITEADTVNGNFRLGFGNVGEYYYRDDIYEYHDITNGNRICHDHEDGFYIETLTDFYDVNDMKDRDYTISLSEVSSEINNEYLLSREPEKRRK